MEILVQDVQYTLNLNGQSYYFNSYHLAWIYQVGKMDEIRESILNLALGIVVKCNKYNTKVLKFEF